MLQLHVMMLTPVWDFFLLNFKRALRYLPDIQQVLLCALFIFKFIYLCQTREHMSAAAVTIAMKLKWFKERTKIHHWKMFSSVVRWFRRRNISLSIPGPGSKFVLMEKWNWQFQLVPQRVIRATQPIPYNSVQSGIFEISCRKQYRHCQINSASHSSREVLSPR